MIASKISSIACRQGMSAENRTRRITDEMINKISSIFGSDGQDQYHDKNAMSRASRKTRYDDKRPA